jgi:hypothetical protein
MKTKLLAGLAGLIIVITGCVSTVNGSKTFSYSLSRDQVQGRYERSLDQVYQAAVQVIQNDGTLLTEYIPHDSTNSIRSLYGKVNDRNVYMRVESVDPRITAITVQARTKYGGTDILVAHELEKEVALQLQAESAR